MVVCSADAFYCCCLDLMDGPPARAPTHYYAMQFLTRVLYVMTTAGMGRPATCRRAAQPRRTTRPTKKSDPPTMDRAGGLAREHRWSAQISGTNSWSCFRTTRVPGTTYRARPPTR